MSKIQLLLVIIQTALAGLSAIPAGQAVAGEGIAFINILRHALQAYQLETGQPLDLTKIPLETHVQ